MYKVDKFKDHFKYLKLKHRMSVYKKKIKFKESFLR